MPKKKAKSTSSNKYRHFRLHGNHPKDKILLYSIVAFVAGLALGVVLQPYIYSLLLTYSPY